MHMLNITSSWKFGSCQRHSIIGYISGNTYQRNDSLEYRSTNYITQTNICMIWKLTATKATVTWQGWSCFVQDNG
jgi:hypothetical protein